MTALKRLKRAEREQVRLMFGGRCAYCGDELGDRWHADHFHPVERKLKRVEGRGVVCTNEAWQPEADCLENRMPACSPCNIDKHAFSLEAWRRKLQQTCRVLRDNSTTYRHGLRFGLLTETGAQVVFYFERVAAEAAGQSDRQGAAA